MAVLVLNFAIGFAVILGKVERTHSWYVFTQPIRVVEDVVNVFISPDSMLAFIGFGLLFNAIYFGFYKMFSKVK